MSKSYDNFIWIFDSEKILKKKIMSIVTWSESLEDEKNPDNCNVFALIKLFADQNKQDEIATKYREWNYGYWHAKLELLNIILEYFKEARERFDSFENDISYINDKLNKGNSEANELADDKYNKMVEIVWLSK